MKGLLLKDFYMIRSALATLLLVFIVMGICLSYLVSPWVLTVLATVMLGMNVASTITMDKTSGWLKTIVITPISRKSFINSKYVMYFLLSIVGLMIGIIFGTVSTLMIDGNTKMVGLFICISLTMALISGSVILPFYFLFDESKSVIGTILAYPISAAIAAGWIYFLGNTTSTYILAFFTALCLFLVSWYLSWKILSQKDI